MPPANLSLGKFLLSWAVLPGGANFWSVYRRLDEGALCHAEYLGLLPVVAGETAAQVVERVFRSWPDLKE